MPTEKEMKKIEVATIYELRLLLASDKKEQYSKEEIFAILDQFAIEKNSAC